MIDFRVDIAAHRLRQEWQFSAVFSTWHGLCNLPGMVPDDPAPSGRQTMTYANTSLSQLAVSLLGALVAATVFVTAAVGPAGQLI
jgi:hypothetical protein